MKLELSNAERNALLDAAGRERVAPLARAFIQQAQASGLTHLQTIALADYTRRLLESGPSFGGFEPQSAD